MTMMIYTIPDIVIINLNRTTGYPPSITKVETTVHYNEFVDFGPFVENREEREMFELI
jgi:hypothetical protein